MMVSQGLQIALDLLFIATGLFAIGSMIVTWRSVAPRIMQLRGELAQMKEMREFRATIIATVVRPAPRIVAPRMATVSYRPAHSSQPDALRAAA